MTRSAGQMFTVTYGSRALSGPGAFAPSSTGAQSWQAQEQSTAGGTLTNLSSSPQITIYARDGSGTLTTTTSAVAAGSTSQTIISATPLRPAGPPAAR